MADLGIFNYGDDEIRAREINGEACVLLGDIAKVLGISGVSRLASRLPDGVRLTHPIIDRLGRTQNATWVTEAGFYRVVLRSDSPKAEPLIQWVTEDVLPTIRKTGRYGSEIEMLAALPASEMLMLAAKAAERAEKAEAQIKVLEPPATRWHEIAGANGDWAVDQVAKMLVRAGVDTGRNRLFKKMHELGWLYRQGNEWHVKQTALNWARLRANRPVTNLKTGELKNVPPTVRITGRGLDRLAIHFGVGMEIRRIAADEQAELTAGGAS